MLEMSKAYNEIWSRWGEATYRDKGWQKFQDKWFYERFQLTKEEFQQMLKDKTALEIGTGAGAFIRNLLDTKEVYGLDISEEGIKIGKKVWGFLPFVHLIRCGLMEYQYKGKPFDIVIADQVLHHVCPDTYQAFKKAVSLLKTGGVIFFYVYRKKGLIREFVDTYIRMLTRQLSVSQCLLLSDIITKIGRTLSQINLHFQRTIHFKIAKCFWNPNYLYENNLRNNFDWYHPKIVNRHDLFEILSWCDKENLDIVTLNIGESGISARAIKR